MSNRQAKKIVKKYGKEWFDLNIKPIGGGALVSEGTTLRIPPRWDNRKVRYHLRQRDWWMMPREDRGRSVIEEAYAILQRIQRREERASQDILSAVLSPVTVRENVALYKIMTAIDDFENRNGRRPTEVVIGRKQARWLEGMTAGGFRTVGVLQVSDVPVVYSESEDLIEAR